MLTNFCLIALMFLTNYYRATLLCDNSYAYYLNFIATIRRKAS